MLAAKIEVQTQAPVQALIEPLEVGEKDMIDTITLIAGYLPICVFAATLFASIYVVNRCAAQERVHAVVTTH
jgi:hypothetical protein